MAPDRGEGEGVYGPGVDYRLHDTQVEAVDRRLEDWVWEFSEFLDGDRLPRFARDEDGPDEYELHGGFADVLNEAGDHPNRAKAHYETALDLNSSDSWLHNNYANLLSEEESVRDIEAAKAHYEAALREKSPTGELLDSTYADAHNNYAVLLENEESVRDIEAAKAHYEAALREKSPTGELLDSTYADAHYNYALLLKNKQSMRDIEAAKAHYERAARLFSARGPQEHFRVAVRGLIGACDASSSTASAVHELYRVSVHNTAEGFDVVAAGTANGAWEQRADLSPEDDAFPAALAAGVWYAVHHSLAGWEDTEEVVETVRETVEPHLDRLSPAVRALYTLRFADETAATPGELRERLEADDDRTALEIDAYERLMGAFGD